MIRPMPRPLDLINAAFSDRSSRQQAIAEFQQLAEQVVNDFCDLTYGTADDASEAMLTIAAAARQCLSRCNSITNIEAKQSRTSRPAKDRPIDYINAAFSDSATLRRGD